MMRGRFESEAGASDPVGSNPGGGEPRADDPGSAPAIRDRWPGGFDDAYAGVPPWDIGAPQPAIVELAASTTLASPVLDVGCGSGDNAIHLATLGLDVVGVDESRRAIARARDKATEAAVAVEFAVWNALELGSFGRTFGTVLDSGLFHVFSDAERGAFARELRQAVEPGGRYFLLCFSDRMPGRIGPRRVSEREIRDTFADGWRIDSITTTTFLHALSRRGAAAWLAAMTRTEPG